MEKKLVYCLLVSQCGPVVGPCPLTAGEQDFWEPGFQMITTNPQGGCTVAIYHRLSPPQKCLLTSACAFAANKGSSLVKKHNVAPAMVLVESII